LVLFFKKERLPCFESIMMPAPGATPLVPIPLADVLATAMQLERAGKAAEAERLTDHILAVYPAHAEALHLKGIAAAALGRDADAASLLERAIAHGLEQPHYYRNICAIYERLGRLDQALAAGRRAVALDATDAESYHNLTVVHARRLELDDAIGCARTALSLDPTRAGAHLALAEALLMRGDLAEGWPEYEWRFRLPGVSPPLPRTDRPQWDGAPLTDGTLLLVADQGFGDVIQFCRYIPWAAARCARLVIACAAELQPLVRQVAPEVPMFSKWNECPPYAAYAALSGLPLVHGTVLDTIPAAVPYLRAEPARAAAWRARIARMAPRGHLLVGLAWAGRPTHSNDRNRSAPLLRLRALFGCAGVTFVSLQKGDKQAEIGAYFGTAPLFNLGASIEDFRDTSAIIEALDLVISVDTSVAHLAAAMGKPTWIMLPFAPDWRWLLERNDSPWYPDVRLFRQSRRDDWEGVAIAIKAALEGGKEAVLF
jgi:tetratricopeptide (TPR) repeat protein